MAKSDGAGMPKHRKRPLLSLLRESGDALEAASPPFDAASAAARLCEAARTHGLLRSGGIPEDDLAVTDFRLEEEAPPFDVEAGAARLREAAKARGLLPSDPDISRPKSHRPPGSGSQEVPPFGPDIAWPEGFRPPGSGSQEVLPTGPDISRPKSHRPPDSGSRRVPFGPDIAWPSGFRQLDPESRRLLESGYGTGPIYQQPAMDDYGYRDPGYSNPVPDGSRPADPRLEGMTYGEMRYNPVPEGSGESGYDEPLDDESRVEELRRSAPAYPQRSGGPQGPGGPPQRDEPQVPAHGRQPGDSR